MLLLFNYMKINRQLYFQFIFIRGYKDCDYSGCVTAEFYNLIGGY